MMNEVAGIDVRPSGTLSFKLAGVQSGGKQIEVKASVLPKATANLPTLPVSPVTKWKHLSDLEFAYPNHGTPARVDILLGGKIFSMAVLTAGGLVPSDHHLGSRCASVGY